MSPTPDPYRAAARDTFAAAALALLLLAGSAGPAAAQSEPQPPVEPAPAATPQEPQVAPPAAVGEEPAAGEASEPAGEAAAEEGETGEKPKGPTLPPALQRPERSFGAERISFRLPLAEEQGGGVVEGTAGSIDFARENYVILDGGVELAHRDLKLAADRAEVDLSARTVHAEGDVVLDQGPQRLIAESIDYDLDERTGTLTNAIGYVDPDYIFGGAQLVKEDENSYSVTNGYFTSCTDLVPDWSFRVKRAHVDVGGYARVHGATMKVKKAPVLYIPYLLWPAKEERASGLLVPQPGYSSRRGAGLSLAYFQTLGRSYDTTFFVDLYSKEYFGFGNEFRYHPTEGTEGRFEAFAIDDPERDEVRWRLRLDHVTEDLPAGMRAVVAIRDYSDFDYFRDFEREFDRVTTRSIYSRGFITGNWGSHSLNILADSRETLISQDSIITQRSLPEVEYRLRPTRLGKIPLYLEVDSSLAYLDLERSPTYAGDYGRFDLFPLLTLPLRSWPWLSLSVSAGQRVTWYGDSLCTRGTGGDCPTNALELTGDSLTRSYPVAGAELVGPSFSRIFDGAGPFSKLKHVIEPRWTYSFQGELGDDEFSRAPLFDERDSVRRSNNLGRFTLVNRLLAKPADEEKGGSAREILSLELSQAYSFDADTPLQRSADDESRRGPVDALLRFATGAGTDLQVAASYNTLFDRLTSRSLTGSYAFGDNRMGLTWFTRFRAEDGEKVDDQARLWGSLWVWPQRLRLEAQVNYDIVDSELQQQRYLVHYSSQCFTTSLEVREYRRGVDITDRDYRFLLTLKNVGTFLDLSGRQSSADDF
jgi:LPS-assembly protein